MRASVALVPLANPAIDAGSSVKAPPVMLPPVASMRTKLFVAPAAGVQPSRRVSEMIAPAEPTVTAPPPESASLSALPVPPTCRRRRAKLEAPPRLTLAPEARVVVAPTPSARKSSTEVVIVPTLITEVPARAAGTALSTPPLLTFVAPV